MSGWENKRDVERLRRLDGVVLLGNLLLNYCAMCIGADGK